MRPASTGSTRRQPPDLGIIDPVVPADWPHPEYVEVVLHWDSVTPDATVLEALRKLLPELARLPVSQLRARLVDQSSWCMGVADSKSATELGRRGEALGLRVEIGEPIPAWDPTHECIPFDPAITPNTGGDDESRLCPLCKLRPGRLQPSQHGPYSDFCCDPCNTNRAQITPMRVLFTLLVIAAGIFGLWRFLTS